MGVKNLLKILVKNGLVVKKLYFNTDPIFKNKRIAIDVSILFRRQDYTNFILDLIIRILKNGSVPVFIFDVGSPKIKAETQEKRKKIIKTKGEAIEEKKNKLKELEETELTEENMDDIMEKKSIAIEQIDKLTKNYFNVTGLDNEYLQGIFELMGISQFAVPNHEAEGLCSYLNKVGIVDMVLTEDQDVIPYGAVNWIRQYKRNSNVVEYCDLTGSPFNHERLIKLTFLLGNDYNDSLTTERFAVTQSQMFSLEQITKDLVPNYKEILAEFEYDYKDDLPVDELKQLNPNDYRLAIQETLVGDNIKKIKDLITKKLGNEAYKNIPLVYQIKEIVDNDKFWQVKCSDINPNLK